MRLITLFALTLLLAASAGAKPRGLQIYLVDTDGGAATLIVTPAGESVLVDAGWPGGQDAARIQAAAKQAGVRAIDHMVTTHWHLDHYAGVPDLARVMPIRRFYDRGMPAECPDDPKYIQAYKDLVKGRAVTLRPGDKIALKQVKGAPPVSLRCLCASGEVVPDAPGAPQNPLARDHQPRPEDTSDNAKSIGLLLTFGDFRFVVLGDITWNVEYRLAAPTDKVGRVDVYQVDHHGVNLSNNPVLVRTLAPRVALMSCGPAKGCDPETVRTIRALPSPCALYQTHRGLRPGAENTEPARIANPEAKCSGEPLLVTVAPDARTYTVKVGLRGITERYQTLRKR